MSKKTIRRPYRYAYKDVATRVLATIPDSIRVYIPSPFEINSHNRYYLFSCKFLHPTMNVVSVLVNGEYIPITSRELYLAYLGGIHNVTFRKFLYEAMDINLMAVIQGKNGKDYFVVNPVYASHRNLELEPVSRIFGLTSRYCGSMEIDEKYILDNIKPQSDKRLEM